MEVEELMKKYKEFKGSDFISSSKGRKLSLRFVHPDEVL